MPEVDKKYYTPDYFCALKGLYTKELLINKWLENELNSIKSHNKYI